MKILFLGLGAILLVIGLLIASFFALFRVFTRNVADAVKNEELDMSPHGGG